MISLLVSVFWLLLLVGGGIYLAYQRIDLRTSTIAASAATFAYTIYTLGGNGYWLWMLLLWVVVGALIVPNLVELRREKITKPLLAIYRRMLPTMSDKEREALEAGWNEEPIGPGYAAAIAPRYFNWRKSSIYGGSNEIQKNIIAKAVLGL